MGWHEGDEVAEQELIDSINSYPHKTMDRNLKDTIIIQDKRRANARPSKITPNPTHSATTNSILIALKF